MPRVMVLSDLWQPFPGGAERLMHNLANYLDQRGMTVEVLTGYENARQHIGPIVTAQAIGDGDGDPGWGPVAEFIDAFGPDVILTHHHYARLFAADLTATGIPVVQVVLNGQRLDCAVHAVYITEHVRQLDPTARPSDQTIWPWAVPADVTATSHGDAVGFIKPIPHKGVGLVYRIAEAMPHRRFLVLRGEWQTLEVLSDLRNVEYMEPVDDIRRFWERVDRVLVPSLIEDAGTVAQEAAANGVPCISSHVDGLVETNGGGILLDPGAVGEWVRSIAEMDDPDRAAAVVDRMRFHLADHDHPARLNRLADIIAGLA